MKLIYFFVHSHWIPLSQLVILSEVLQALWVREHSSSQA